MDSIFNLQRPYDLVALLKQEERAENLENLKRELLSKKAEIDQNEDQDTGKIVSWKWYAASIHKPSIAVLNTVTGCY